MAAGAAASTDKCTIQTLAEEYAKLCSAQKIPTLRPNELIPLCENLSVCGLLALGGSSGKKPSGGDGGALSRSVWLCISAADLKLATEHVRDMQRTFGWTIFPEAWSLLGGPWGDQWYVPCTASVYA